MLPLADAAVCRSESDWLVGINGTRAMTAFNSKSGGFQLTTVGRVQTPTLAILVEREEKIKKFVARDYFEVHATFACKAGEYAGRWFDEKFGKDKKTDDGDLRAERLWERARADAIRAKCEGKTGIVEEESKPSTQLSPLLYDLTSLQREANGRFGFSAKTTLSIAQALYEKHKVLTYPRTDSRALPEDYLADGHRRDAGARQAVSAVRQTDTRQQMGASEQAHFQQRQDFRPLRDHSDLACAQTPERSRSQNLRSGHQAFSRGVFSRPPNSRSRPRASRASKASRSRAKARSW